MRYFFLVMLLVITVPALTGCSHKSCRTKCVKTAETKTEGVKTVESETAGLKTVETKTEAEEPVLPNFDTLWNYKDAAATEMKFKEFLPEAEEFDRPGYTAALLSQLARAQGLQGKFDEALATLENAESMLDDETVTARVRCLLERGRVMNSSGKKEESIPYFTEAWETALEAGEDFHAVDAAHMMGIVTPPEEQLVWSEKAMEVAERSEDRRTKGWLGPLYNNTGWTYHDMGNYKKALEIFEKSLEWRESAGDAYGTRIAKWTIGRTYRSLGRIEEALAVQEALLAEFEAAGAPPDGYVYEELGENHLLLGNEAEAKKNFGAAYELLSKDKWLAKHEKERLDRMKKLSE